MLAITLSVDVSSYPHLIPHASAQDAKDLALGRQQRGCLRDHDVDPFNEAIVSAEML